MSLQILRDGPELTAGKYYLTEGEVKSASGDLSVDILTPSDSGDAVPSFTASDEALTKFKALSKYVNRDTIGAGVFYGKQGVLDNLQCREWTGRHAKAAGATKPSVVSGGISLINAPIVVDSFAANLAKFSSAQSWSAFFVVRRTVGSFGGNAHLQFFGCDNAATHQLMPCYFTQDGTVKASGIVNGGAASGISVAGLLPNDTLKVIGVSSKVGEGWTLFDETGEDLGGDAIGTGAGVSFSQFTGWAGLSPVAYLGATRATGTTTASAGNAILYRNLFYVDLNAWDHAHKFLKVLSKLRLEYGIEAG